MGHTITVRLNEDLAEWLKREARKTGVSQGKIVRDQLERAKTSASAQSFMRLAGIVHGGLGMCPPGKGFSGNESHRRYRLPGRFRAEKRQHHDWAVGLASRVTEPLLTCEAVLAEATFHLRSASLVFAMLTEGLVTVAFSCNDDLPRLAALAKTYADREPDLADLCLIRMSEIYPRHSVITVDRGDFRVYRATSERRSL